MWRLRSRPDYTRRMRAPPALLVSALTLHFLDIDRLIGNFTTGREMPHWVELWENLAKQGKPGA